MNRGSTIAELFLLCSKLKNDLIFQVFNNLLTHTSCKLMWQNLVHPTINRAKWTPDETSRLVNLVREEVHQHRVVNWERVAENLATDRTACQTLVKFKQTCVSQMDRRKWTAAEDERLMLIVEDCRINNYIPWTKVSYYMFNR